MSGALSSALARFRGALPALPRLPAGGVFNASGRAGPRRPLVIIGLMLGVIVLVVVVTSLGRRMPAVSHDARMGMVDPLPGGLNSTPEQDKLALQADRDAAERARLAGASYTARLAPSVLAQPPAPTIERPTPAPPTRLPLMGAVRRPPQTVPGPLQVSFPAPLPPASPAPEQPQPVRVAATTTAQDDHAAEQAYDRQIAGLFALWGGHLPETVVVLPPPADAAGDPVDPAEPARGAAAGAAAATARPTAAPASAAAPPAALGRLLIPAGRGVYAHPVVALNSDQSSPVVLQADSGPIAGDRMIGTFAKESDRLVLHIGTIIHNGESIGVDGFVVTPDTMEAGVATGVDQHYMARFILPAAAAFVAGLGQAIQTTSNTTAVLSPLGGATTTTHLGLDQQLGVAAGVAAAQVAQALSQAAPKGPTVTLDINAAVGVMFLTDVRAHRGQ